MLIVKNTITLLVLALITIHPAWADVEVGQRALDAGSVDKAVAQWQQAANAGDGRAMLELGRLYLQGLGVIQDYVEAHKWFNLAASRGVAEALDARDTLAAKMTPAQVATAQERAAAWQSGGTPDSTRQADTSQPPAQAIREAQTLLTTLGYDPGQADGVWGGRTIEAYRTFLNDAGLPAGEELTPDALLALRALAGGRGTAAGAPTTATAPQPEPALRPDALHQAAQAGDSAGLKAALSAGADVDALDGQGWTALMHAANRGYPQFVDLLLEAKADPDIQAPDGATALFIATVRGQAQVVARLVDAGADVFMPGPEGKTAADMARVSGDRSVMNALGEVAIAISELNSEMVSIPGGSFRMGDLSGEGAADEKPVRTVTVPAFKLGKYEVTFAQWDACVADGNCYSPEDEGWGRSDRPVINVSWDDVQSFIRWFNRKTGGNYRLPSEAEWEYAARAESTTEYSKWGDEGTAPVGSFPANAWGLHDMHGNVSEWVQDCWNDSYEGAPTDGSAWTRGHCGQRVVRGSSWDFSWRRRFAENIVYDNRGRDDNIGFRLAQDE